jgi:hypothetical protein
MNLDNLNQVSEELEASEETYRKSYMENMNNYRLYLDKFRTWKTDQIFAKLRALGVVTSRFGFIQQAENSFSAYEVFKSWLETFKKERKLLENFGIAWAGAEALWMQLSPDLFSVEEFIRIKENLLHNSNQLSEYNRFMLLRENWNRLVELLPEEFDRWTFPRHLWANEDWLEETMRDMCEVAKKACTEKNKLLPEITLWFAEVAEIFTDVKDESMYYVKFWAWVSVVNNRTETLEHILTSYQQRLLNDTEFFTMLGDLYKKPLPFAFNQADELKALSFYNQFLDKLG